MSEHDNKAANYDAQNIGQNNAIGAGEFVAPSQEQETSSFRLTPAHGALFVLGLLCLTFIAFITFAKSIQVTAVTPNLNQPDDLLLQPADLSIHTTLKLPLGNRVLVLPGEHTISLQAPGYQTVEQTLKVEGDRHQQFEIVMLRLPGKLQVTLPEGVTAKAVIDGDEQTPFDVPDLLENLSAGTHEISIDADLYRPFSKTITVQGKGQTQELNVELGPAWAEYELITEPAGADITVDGVVKAQTPAVVRIEEGTRDLVLKAAGFKAYQRELSVVAQETIAVPPIELIPADGVIDVASKPEGAAVILNNEFKGITPLTLAVAPNVEQSLKVYNSTSILPRSAIHSIAASGEPTASPILWRH